MFIFFQIGCGPPSFLFNMYRFFFLREADHSPPFSSEVKKEWFYTTTPHTCLYDVYKGTFNFITLIYIALTGQRKVNGCSTCLESIKTSISLFWSLFNINQCREQMYRLPRIQLRPRNSLLITQSCEVHSTRLSADPTVNFVNFVWNSTLFRRHHKISEKRLLPSSCLPVRME
jgi:hypothetical protein